jgi:hypothetical protein
MQGSYHGGNTASRPISEVKHRWALLVLAYESSLEPSVTLCFCFYSFAPFFSCTSHRRGVSNSVVVCCHSCDHIWSFLYVFSTESLVFFSCLVISHVTHVSCICHRVLVQKTRWKLGVSFFIFVAKISNTNISRLCLKSRRNM